MVFGVENGQGTMPQGAFIAAEKRVSFLSPEFVDLFEGYAVSLLLGESKFNYDWKFEEAMTREEKLASECYLRTYILSNISPIALNLDGWLLVAERKGGIWCWTRECFT